MWKQKRILGLLAVITLTIVLAACGNSNENNENSETEGSEDNNTNSEIELGQTELQLGSDDYVSNLVNTYLAKLLLEEIGYTVEVNQTDVGVQYTGLADGATDVIVGAWLPNTHGSYWEEYQDDLVEIGTVTEEVELGLVVPSYMEDINSIEDLRDNTNDIGEQLEWEITGISPGAGQMQLMEDSVIPGYELNDWTLVESSGAAMSTSLGDAINNEEPIVVTLWTPHWTFNEYDLKILEDPQNAFGDPDDILSVSRTGFEEDAPAAHQLISQFSITKEDTQEMMFDVQEGMDPEAAAQAFMDENPDLVEEWLDGLN
ncbi:glycine betaine ABC transporter substrate-binding protein [Virgibacillus sp. NKC19-16]|uniref:glycine betaine ABC transporter substrate-binding protein n=1 Tax=Virgibacillus salidurans TaxID=2831673 RepID=UPI001F17EF54|nr:glycine betaine ABC transporter substrate-binding protein [Virgibacillus sp. NKC19-16]UJL45881.1 glycine betaine ABC transporter substrate-binding protein [Virgibacillus sp. NKC19-16]